MRFGLFSVLFIGVISILIAGENEQFTLTSSGFNDGGRIPAKFAMKKARGGRNVSPPLSWQHAPAGTKSYVLTVIDTNPVARKWVHWLVLNIPVETTGLTENASHKTMPSGAHQLNNSFGFKGYGGPLPPRKTGIHDYVFTIYALNVSKIDTNKAFLTGAEVQKLISGKVVGKACLTGKFSQ